MLQFSIVLAFLSGAAGLAHQILWTRRLVDVLGASADTFSKVVGAFFVGLALGAWFASRPAPTETKFWKRVSWAELLAAHDSGQFFLTLEIAAKLNLPLLAELKGQMLDRLPESLRQDKQADWQQWPMRVKPGQ